MHYSSIGVIAGECIKDISNHTSYAEVINYVIMPNHIHMVISVGAQYIAPTTVKASANIGCLRHSRHGEPCTDFHHNSLLAVTVRTFKAAVTRLMRAQCIAPLPHLWQRNFHEHIIRNQRVFDNIMNYIDTNVENWRSDRFNTNCNGESDAFIGS